MDERRKVTFPSANSLGDGHGVLIGDPTIHRRGLIVIHEWWGMNEQIQDQGAKLGREGQMTVLVCDMYRGKVAIDREQAGHYMHGLDWDGAVQDISGAANYLLYIGCTKVGVTGFCMGGALAFSAAALCPQISAAVPFYGIPSTDLAQIHIPVQAHFGELDDIVGFSSPADYNQLYERLTTSGVPYEMFTYPAGHGFTKPTNPTYNADATALAFSRLYKFMDKHLSH
jgi:carboxymethylenebutenolidase